MAREAELLSPSSRPDLRIVGTGFDPKRVVETPAAWNEALERFNGNLQQSWEWGEFRRLQGWDVERLAGSSPAGEWMVQVLFRPAGPVSAALIPRGPSLLGDHELLVPLMMKEIDRVARKHRATTLIIDPNQRWELKGSFKQHGFVKWLNPVNPPRNWHALALPDEEILAGMQSRKRRRIGQAVREGCTIERRPINDDTIDRFHFVVADTAARKNIPCFSRSYVADMVNALRDRSEIWFVVADGEPQAVSIFAWFGKEVTYQLGATSTAERGPAAGTYIIYEALRYFRDRGFTHLDMGNIAPQGLRDFKTCFPGVEVNFPPSMERRYNAVTSFLTRRVMEHRY
jgi:lipid II:glycine glycyltransferase (peptidoglycan interpeptide bridge formation enzyme)